MTVEDLKEMIAELPDSMRVIIPVGDDIFAPLCHRSETMEIISPGEPPQEFLVLMPCQCETDDVPIIVDVNPN